MSYRIVVLDGFTLSPLPVDAGGDPHHPDWAALKEWGALTVHDRTPAREVLQRCAGAEVVLTNKVVLDASTINALENLRYIGVMATGTNVVDLEAAAKRGVVVTNVPGYSTPSVCQLTIALILEATLRLGQTCASVREGGWAACPDFSYTLSPFHELSGKTLGLVGFGAIARGVGQVADALGMKVHVHSRSEKPSPYPVEWVSKERLLAASDVISLHCPLTDQTKHFIDRAAIAEMKRTAILINTARGPLIDEEAVAGALREERIGGFAADVLSKEPPPHDHPLIRAPRSFITPHLGWSSVESRHRLMAQLAENLRAFDEGTPIHRVA